MKRWTERPATRRLVPALPALAALALVLLSGTPSPAASAVLMALVVVTTALAVRGIARNDHDHLRTLGNLLDALREGDLGVRSAPRGGDWAFLSGRFNALAEHLHDERRAQQEHLQLLANSLAALDGAVFAFDSGHRVRWMNPAGEALLGPSADQWVGRHAGEVGLASLFELPSGTIQAHGFGGARGRWQVKHAVLRSRSQSGWLLVLQPMERELREEEAQAFRRVLRVLGHEINNSMAPIASMADTLGRLLPAAGSVLDASLRDDIQGGLTLIEQRSQSLQGFLGGYARLARLPAPRISPFPLRPVCERVQGLMDTSLVLEIEEALWLRADMEQIEQVLINLVRNALEAGGEVPVRLRAEAAGAGLCRIQVIDEGAGLPASDSLFVPFFTTKPNGSGIGLVLSRQIIEAQDGSLALRPGANGRGAVAEAILPLHEPGRASSS